MVAFLVPMGLQGIRAAAPYAMRYGAKPAGKAIKYGLGAIRNYFRPGSKIVKVPGPTTGKGAINFKVPSRNAPPQFQNKPMFSIGGTNPANIALQTGITAATAAPFAYDYLTSEAEQSANTPPAGSGGPVDTVPDPVKPKEKPKDDAKMTSDQIKSGELDDFIKERIDLFEKYIGDDTRKRTKTAGYNAMVQFGLNLATKRGSLVEGIAESAKEPLKEFAKLGNDLMDRAASIKKAGIESGVSAYDKAQDREIDEKAIAADIIKEKIKASARNLSPGEFYAKTMADIQSSDELRAQIESVNYKEDGRTLVDKPTPVEKLYERYINDSYNAYNSVEIPKGQAGQELIQSLPSGTRFYDLETGKFGRIP
tara:strand:- start:1052 stop:2152 length:1101 start_codon:yes stop_codon:yes gene_type:complete